MRKLLTEDERRTIEECLKKKFNIRRISHVLGRSFDTIRREIHKNGNIKNYSAAKAIENHSSNMKRSNNGGNFKIVLDYLKDIIERLSKLENYLKINQKQIKDSHEKDRKNK